MGDKRYNILNKQLLQIEEFIAFKDNKNTEISKASVGWHLDHVLKVFNTISEWVIKSNPKDYKRQYNFWRTLLFPFGYIPRGKAKSPKIVLPPETVTFEDLQNQLQIARKNIANLRPLPRNTYFTHFIFGMLHKPKTLRFLDMHTNHHLKIVKDILNQ